MKYIFKLYNKNISGNKILFLDRDGVVIEDTGYPNEINKLQFNFKIIENIIKFKLDKNFDACGFVTNQSGVSRGYFSEEEFWQTHDYIKNKCIKNNLKIDFTAVNFFQDPHYYRKPSPGMLESVIDHFLANRSSCYMIGDKNSDKVAAEVSKINYISVENFNT